MYYKYSNTHTINRTKTNIKVNAQNTNSHTGNQGLFFAAGAGFEPARPLRYNSNIYIAISALTGLCSRM